MGRDRQSSVNARLMRIAPRPRMLIAAVAVAAGLTCAATVDATATGSDAVARATRDLTPLPASLQFASGGHRIPRGFFGLSIEYNELASYEDAGTPFLNLISMLRPRDGGPMLLRVGGKSADHALWEPTAAAAPAHRPKLGRGVFELNAKWLPELRQLVQREDMRVILDLNLAVHSTTMATAFAKAVQQGLPGGAIAGMEIGNEPDEYHYQPPLSQERVPTTNPRTPLSWWRNYSPADYRRDYTSYARALKADFPGIALGAPDVTSPNPAWLTAVTGLGRLNPGFLAVHLYASSTCWPSNSPGYPTIPRLLAQGASAGLAGSVTSAIGFAHKRQMAFRLTEVNSVSCGGNAGVANTFASALWAPDALFSLIDAGVDGVSWHIRPKKINAPFQLMGTGIVALPELYGLAVFAKMTHGPATVLATSLSSSSKLNLRAWAVQNGGTVNVLVINKGARAADVSLPARGRAPAVVRRLTAPGIRATSGIRFAGMTIGPDGRWHGREVESRLANDGGDYRLFIAGYSAALVTL
jgi:hypothetical protein